MKRFVPPTLAYMPGVSHQELTAPRQPVPGATRRRTPGSRNRAQCGCHMLRRAGSFTLEKGDSRSMSTCLDERMQREHKERRRERMQQARAKGSHSPQEWAVLCSMFPFCLMCGRSAADERSYPSRLSRRL